MFDNDTGRLLVKLIDTFQRCIRIVDVVIGKCFSLELFSSSNARWLDTRFNIKGGRLVRVFTVAEFLSALKLRCDVFG